MKKQRKTIKNNEKQRKGLPAVRSAQEEFWGKQGKQRKQIRIRNKKIIKNKEIQKKHMLYSQPCAQPRGSTGRTRKPSKK